MGGVVATWQISFSTQRQAILGPLHHPPVAHDHAGQGHRLAGHHHLVLGLLGEVGSMGGCRGERRRTTLETVDFINKHMELTRLSAESVFTGREPKYSEGARMFCKRGGKNTMEKPRVFWWQEVG